MSANVRWLEQHAMEKMHARRAPSTLPGPGFGGMNPEHWAQSLGRQGCSVHKRLGLDFSFKRDVFCGRRKSRLPADKGPIVVDPAQCGTLVLSMRFSGLINEVEAGRGLLVDFPPYCRRENHIRDLQSTRECTLTIQFVFVLCNCSRICASCICRSG